jgi:hypothetical protein
MRPFKIKEEAYIREHYGTTPLSQIAAQLGRRKSTVTAHIKLMGLKLTPEQRERMTELSKFKKGQTPHNKGTKGVSKRNVTSFASGHTPHNTKFDGAVSIRQKKGDKPYKYIRIDGVWKLLHRHLWEQAHGPIPANHLVSFKDGDSMRCELDNLELITKAENAKRNVNREKAGKALKKKWERVKKLESLGIEPAFCKFRSKRKPSKKTSHPIVIAQSDLINLPEHRTFL